MPDYRVTFKGDLGNLRQFDAAIKNSAVEGSRAIEAANQRVISSIGKVSGPLQSDSGAGLFSNKQRTQIDAYNRTLRHSGEVIRRVVSDYKILKDANNELKLQPIFTDLYTGSIDKAIGDMDRFEAAQKKLASSEQKIGAIRKKAREDELAIQTRIQELQSRKGGLASQLREAETTGTTAELLNRARSTLSALTGGNAFISDGQVFDRDTIEQRIRNIQRDVTERPVTDTAALNPGQIAAKLKEAERLSQLLRTDQSAQLAPLISQAATDVARLETILSGVTEPLRKDIALTNAEIEKLDKKAASVRRKGERDSDIVRRSNPAYAESDAALKAIRPIQKDLAAVLDQSAELKKRLLRGGLGAGASFGSQEFKAALDAQDAQVSRYTENLRTNVRTVQGSFRDLKTGVIKDFTVDLDENGKVVGRWGGQLRGAGTFIKQTVRDFQKVVEWTIATTVVFGALATVVGQLSSINELNTSLARFSITAQTTAVETQALFQQLSQVAFDTATPLKEIVTVADDIALATREAGDSTEEWQGKIIDLTTAVGIFTNLTGKDTVTAAEQLSSAFKQLDIEPSELIGVLNKVTAVAGGQAGAIADIVQSVAGLAEAAKAAGFSVDEQIASVQVLAQVTNKTSAEIATSFKNLFGSIGSVGSSKILEQFGIAIRDENGEMKDFLAIYREISEALKSGVIPEGRLPDVIRGIAGGPRRAPDAAALLANIDRIDEVVERSQAATNEALIANAKVLDTNQARLVRFQNAFDVAVFEKFGKAVEDLTRILTEFGIAGLDAVGGLDSQLLSTIVQLTLFATAGRLIGGVVRNLVPSFASMKKGLSEIGDSLIRAKRNSDVFINSAERLGRPVFVLGKGSRPIPKDGGGFYKPGQAIPRDVAEANGVGRGQQAIDRLRRMSPLGRAGLFGGLTVAGAVGAKGLQGTISGEFDKETVASILQVGGAVATLIPGLQAVGLAAIVAGTGLSFLGSEGDKVVKSQAELSSEIFTLIQNLQAVQTDASNAGDRQKEAAAIMEELGDKSKKTAEEQLRLSDATTEFVTATLAMASANQQVAATFDVLLEKLPGLAGEYEKFKAIMASGLGPNNPQIKELQQRLATDILRNSGQAIYSGSTIDIADQYRAPRSGTTAGLGLNYGGNLTDLSQLTENPNLIRELLDKFGDAAVLKIPQNDASIGLVRAAVAEIATQFAKGESDITEEELNKLIEFVSILSQSASSFAQNTAAFAQQNAAIQSRILTGNLSGDAAENATLANLLGSALNAQVPGYNAPARSPDERGEIDPALAANTKLIAELFKSGNEGLDITDNLLEAVAKNALLLNGTYYTLAQAGEQAFNEGILQWLEEAGVETEVLEGLQERYNIKLRETATINEDLIASLDGAKKSAREAYADRAIQLEIAQNSGSFEDNASGFATLKAQNEEAYQSTLQLIDSIGSLSQDAFLDLNNTLAQVTGLQGLFISETERASFESEDWAARMAELSGQLIENAVAAGVDAEGIQKITREAARLIAVINGIPEYKRVIIEIKQVYTRTGGSLGLAIPGVSQALTDRYNKALATEKAAGGKSIEQIIADINKLLASGSGSNLGQLGTSSTPKTIPYNKPSLLDIPKEIIDANNTNSLLQQAIKNARNLQSLVPGESGANKNEIVELLNGTQRVLETRGIGEEYLRRAMDELTDQIKRQNDLLAKADTIRRVRVGAGGFAAIANVPINSQSGVSVGGPQGPISITLDVRGTLMTPAQFAQWADQIAAALKRQIAS